jgi:hypothetical protein
VGVVINGTKKMKRAKLKRNLKGVSTDSLDFEENAKRGDLSLKLNVLKVKIYKGKVLKCEGD